MLANPSLSPPSILYKTASGVSSYTYSFPLTLAHWYRFPLACLSLLYLMHSVWHTRCSECNLDSPVCVDRWLMSLWMLKKCFTVQRESALCMRRSWWVQRRPPQGSLGNCTTAGKCKEGGSVGVCQDTSSAAEMCKNNTALEQIDPKSILQFF